MEITEHILDFNATNKNFIFHLLYTLLDLLLSIILKISNNNNNPYYYIKLNLSYPDEKSSRNEKYN